MPTPKLVVVTLLTVPALYAAGTAKPPSVPNGPVHAEALWEAPATSHERDLFNGPWGAQSAPDPHATYVVVRPKRRGVNPGLVVKDPRGRTWHVKQAARNNHGEEGPVEVVLSRVLSAVGYHQPPVYFLPSFVIADGSGTHVESGGRFRLREPSIRALGPWSWGSNPFVGTVPYNGLLVILLVFNSWDLKDSNNSIYAVTRSNQPDSWYVVRDLGGALGESGRLSPRRNNIDRFERQRFITGLSKGIVKFSYDGKRPELFRHITVEDVRWANALLSELDDRQWRDAFRAGGYPSDISERFIRKIKANIFLAQQVAHNAWPSTEERR
jgi:hypothetical protein